MRKIPHGAKPNAAGTQLGEAVVNVSNFISDDSGAVAAAAGPGWGRSRQGFTLVVFQPALWAISP